MTFYNHPHSSGRFSLSLGFGFKTFDFVANADDRDRRSSRRSLGFSVTIARRGQMHHGSFGDDRPLDAYGCFSDDRDDPIPSHGQRFNGGIKADLMGFLFDRVSHFRPRFFSCLENIERVRSYDDRCLDPADRVMETESDDPMVTNSGSGGLDIQEILDMTIDDPMTENSNSNGLNIQEILEMTIGDSGMVSINLNPSQPSTIEEPETTTDDLIGGGDLDNESPDVVDSDPIINPGDMSQEAIDLMLEIVEDMEIVPIRVMEMDADNNGTMDIVIVGEDASSNPVIMAGMEQNGMTIAIDLENGSIMAMGDSNTMVLL